ncbi:unnamed protein product [Caenorhabditis nigoni]|uniref:Uncharacterized protein n=1 Tax=Caenorhabditis nigoni TaxID=1611254 RepID=A0A2G5SLY9_9PELO|nr:hypothetical protein B9Z55_022852 [Caenorhabditis nigoni]PIC16155.1 hypothetical protein B9Z55_022855 [Caenorhabditis nigoni]
MASSSNQTPKKTRPVAVVAPTRRQIEQPRPITPPPIQQNVFVVQEPQFGEREEMMGAGGWLEPVGPPMIPEAVNPVALPMIEPQAPMVQGLMVIPPPAIVIQFGAPAPAFPAQHFLGPVPMQEAPGNHLIPPPMGQFDGAAHHLGPRQFFPGQALHPQLQFHPVFQAPPPVLGPNPMHPGVAMSELQNTIENRRRLW